MQGLQGSGIDALIGERIAAGMPEHVRVDFETNLGFVCIDGGSGRKLVRAGFGRNARDCAEPV